MALSVDYCEAAETPGGQVLHHATSRQGVTENIATADCVSDCTFIGLKARQMNRHGVCHIREF